MPEVDEINRLLRELDRLWEQAMDYVEYSPLPDEIRRQELAAVHRGVSLISQALNNARDAYLMHAVESASDMGRVSRILARILEAVRTADIARYPAPLAVIRRRMFCLPRAVWAERPEKPKARDSEAAEKDLGESLEVDPTKFGFVAHVPGVGPEDAEVMIIGEAPGKVEATTGIPFSGPMREWLGGFLRELGLDRSQVFITNAVQRPRVNAQTGDIRPTKPEDSAEDRSYVEREIEKVNPKVVILLGRIAREEWEKPLKAQGRIVIAVPHPSYFARRQDWSGWVECARRVASEIQVALRESF